MSQVAQPPAQPSRLRLAVEAWADAVRQGSPPDETPIVGAMSHGAFVGVGRQDLAVEVADGEEQAAAGSDRVLRYAISSDKPSRRNVEIKQAGLRSTDYHGVILWAHDSCRWDSAPNPPIGRTLRLTQESFAGYTRTIADGLFAGEDQNYELAEMIYLLGRDGFIPDCSVGLDPVKWFHDEDRQMFVVEEWDLLEWSPCPIGQNTDAVKLAHQVQGYGIDWRPFAASLEQILDTLPDRRAVRIDQARSEKFLREMGLLGKVTMQGFFDLGPQLLQLRQPTPPPAPVVESKVREDAGPVEQSAATKADSVAADPVVVRASNVTTETPAAPIAAENQTMTRAEFEAAFRTGIQAAFLEHTGAVVALEE